MRVEERAEVFAASSLPDVISAQIKLEQDFEQRIDSASGTGLLAVQTGQVLGGGSYTAMEEMSPLK